MYCSEHGGPQNHPQFVIFKSKREASGFGAPCYMQTPRRKAVHSKWKSQHVSSKQPAMLLALRLIGRIQAISISEYDSGVFSRGDL